MRGVTGDAAGFKKGLFLFRTLDDCQTIIAHAVQAREAAVIGNGLLGLEAARGLPSRSAAVHDVHLMSYLMEQQLDVAAGTMLRRTLERLGLHVHFEKQTTAVLGNGYVAGLALRDGSTLDCGLVVTAEGLAP